MQTVLFFKLGKMPKCHQNFDLVTIIPLKLLFEPIYSLNLTHVPN